MISNTFQTNTFIGGMDLDTDVAVLDNNKYRYAENVRILTNDNGTSGVLQNIEGIKQYVTEIASNVDIIGVETINNIAVVVTRLNTASNGSPVGDNIIYRVENFDTDPDMYLVVKGELGLCKDLNETPNVSIVLNYETDTNIKAYITDGKSPIKVVNIMSDKYAYRSSLGSQLVDANLRILNPLALDLTPGAVLPPFSIIGLGYGNLPAGTIQYCYQLFNLHGSETALSSLSNVVHLTQSSTSSDSKNYKGTTKGQSSGKSCILEANIQSHDFDRCRIISITYIDKEATPIISIVNEIAISSTQNYINYTDTGNNSMGTITVEEFNALTGYQFIAATIASTNNRLFAANITEDTWNPGSYDARSYRCNVYGRVKLESANASNNIIISDIHNYDLSNIPEDHDCINPYNSITDVSNIDAESKYVYGPKAGSTYILGGHGVNIDYNFTTVPIVVADNELGEGAENSNCGNNVKSSNINSIQITNVGLGSTYTYNFPETLSARQPNYADPHISSRFLGYQRDEVYRFGIIFYNNKNLPSPVYWIGDIRMPLPSDDDMLTFEKSGSDLVGRALGIKFTVKNVPEGAMAYEIVRCDRTESDRTIVMQAAVGGLYNYARNEQDGGVGGGTTLDYTVEYRPPIHLCYQPNLTIWYYDGSNSNHGALLKTSFNNNLVRLISPEICITGKDIEPYFNGATLSPIYSTRSIVNPKDSISDMPDYYRAFCMNYVSLQDNGSEIVANDTQKKQNKYKFYTEDGASIVQIYTPGDGFNFPALIAKQYYLSTSGEFMTNSGTITVEDAKYSNIIPYNGFSNVTPYTQNVGNYTYTNWAMSDIQSSMDGGEHLFRIQARTGPAGPSVVVMSTNIGSKLNIVANTPTIVPVVNIKKSVIQYGGNTYSTRQNSVYIPTGSYVQMTGSSSYETYTYGGDTYLGILDYPVTMTFQANESWAYKDRAIFVGAYIPFESSINLNLLQGDMAHMTHRESDNYLDSHLQIDVTQKQLYHIQDEPYFVYNTVYSSHNGSKQYVPASIYAEDNVRTSNRIYTSQIKTANEVVDSWATFKVADFLDVDNKFGEITNLEVFKDRLFYFQDSAVGVAAVNERALINDNNVGQLTLGTGDVLSRYDYITNTNGSSIFNDRSIVHSDNVLYWYDFDKNEICAYNGQVNQISKEKHVQSYLNEMYDKKRECSLGMFDKKYNEIWFRFYDKSLIFNEQLGCFTSFYTFNPEWALQFSDKTVAIKNNKYFRLNSLDTDNIGSVNKQAKITFIVNKDVQYTKVYDNIRLSGEFKDNNNQLITTGGIVKASFDTKHQTTGEIVNIPIDYREDTYRFAIPRQNESNEDVSLSYPSRMRGKYLACNFTLNSNDENTFKIPYITTTYRYSLI